MMKPETIEYIKNLLELDASWKQDHVLRAIRYDDDVCIQEKIKEYKKAYSAFDDFDDWCDKQERE